MNSSQEVIDLLLGKNLERQSISIQNPMHDIVSAQLKQRYPIKVH
jgi:hypothetical protein